MNKPLILLGSGGHANVLLDYLIQQNKLVKGYVSPEPAARAELFKGLSHYENDKDIMKLDSNTVCLVNGIGSLPGYSLRLDLFELYLSRGFLFERVISPNAYVSPYAELAEGVQVMSGAIIQAGAIIGKNTIVNTGAIIDHDCCIGEYNHISPGSVVCGGVTTGKKVHVGTGASIIQSIEIEDEAIIGAGAVVTKRVPAKNTVYGFRST